MANKNILTGYNGQINGNSSTRITVKELEEPKPYAIIDGEKYYLDRDNDETFYDVVDRCNTEGKLIEEWGFENPPAELVYDPSANKR